MKHFNLVSGPARRRTERYEIRGSASMAAFERLGAELGSTRVDVATTSSLVLDTKHERTKRTHMTMANPPLDSAKRKYINDRESPLLFPPQQAAVTFLCMGSEGVISERCGESWALARNTGVRAWQMSERMCNTRSPAVQWLLLGFGVWLESRYLVTKFPVRRIALGAEELGESKSLGCG